jgi:hypothetical protein
MINARSAILFLNVGLGLAGCNGPGPSPVAPPTMPPPSTEPVVYTLTPSTDTVAPAGVLSVRWTASRGGLRDWIGLFKVGSADCDHGWSDVTRGATSGTFTLTAPSQSGEYEFRYLPDDGCSVVARSSAVVVSQ